MIALMMCQKRQPSQQEQEIEETQLSRPHSTDIEMYGAQKKASPKSPKQKFWTDDEDSLEVMQGGNRLSQLQEQVEGIERTQTASDLEAFTSGGGYLHEASDPNLANTVGGDELYPGATASQ